MLERRLAANSAPGMPVHVPERGADNSPMEGAPPPDPERAREYVVTAEDVYLRTHPMGLVSGTLTRGQHFIATHVQDAWAFGYAMGHADQPGWILMGPSMGQPHTVRPLRNVDDPPELDGVPRDLRTANKINYVRGDARMPKPWEYSFPGTVKPGGLTLYANYDSESGPDDETYTLPAGSEVGVRYLVDDEWAVIQVKSTVAADGKPRWLFARVDEIAIRDEQTAMDLFKRGIPVPDDYRHPRKVTR